MSVVCLGWFWSVSDGTFLAHLKASTVQPLSLHRLDGERPRLSAKQQAGMLAGAFVFVAVSGVVSMLYFAREAAWTRDGACELRKAKAACRLRDGDGEVVVSGMPAVDMELERRVFFSMYQMDFLMRAELLPLARIEAVIDDPHVGCLLTTDVATASRRIGSEDEISFMRVELGDSITRQFERAGSRTATSCAKGDNRFPAVASDRSAEPPAPRAMEPTSCSSRSTSCRFETWDVGIRSTRRNEERGSRSLPGAPSGKPSNRFATREAARSRRSFAST